MALTVNKNHVLNIAIIILALIVAYKINKKQTNMIELLKQSKDKESKRNELLNGIGELEKTIIAYQEFFDQDRSLVINTLGDIAKESNVKIISIRPGPDLNLPMYIKHPFDLVFSADSYHSVGKFISKVESHPNVFIIDSLDIKPVAQVLKEGEEHKLSVSLKLSTISFL